MTNEVSLAEATLEQIAGEINSRSRDFLLVGHTQDGTNGQHTQIYYSHPYGALGLACFAKSFLELTMLEGSSNEETSPE